MLITDFELVYWNICLLKCLEIQNLKVLKAPDLEQLFYLSAFFVKQYLVFVLEDKQSCP